MDRCGESVAVGDSCGLDCALGTDGRLLVRRRGGWRVGTTAGRFSPMAGRV
jgi:hypothetical protein